MVIQRQNLRGIHPTYELTEENQADYKPPTETGATTAQIFIDKRQTITYNINIVTAQETGDTGTRSTITEQTFVFESQISNALLQILHEMEQILDDAASFEQKLSHFLSLLSELDKRKQEREICFSDLLSMLRMVMIKMECIELTKCGVSVLADAVNCLPHKITQDTLQTVRNNFRHNGIDLLKPFKTTLDVKRILQELYPNEVTS